LRPGDHDRGMFFGYFYDVIIRSHAPIFWLGFCWILRKNTSV